MKNIILIGFVALAIGLGIGYYYGNTSGIKRGVESGRADLLAEQEKAAEEATKVAQDKIIEQVNPFSDAKVNPFLGEYTNPFGGATANPFTN